MLKSIYTILFALLFIQPAMSGSWLKNQSKSDVSFGEVCALVRRGDSGYCLVQKDGAIFLSTDGHSWVRSSKYTLGTLSCAHFYDESNGVAAGAKFLEYTTDGGVNWTKVDGVSLNVNAVCMVSEKEAVLACDGGNIGRYVFGKTLTSQKLNIKHNLYSVSFYDGTGYVCGKGGVILKWDGNQWNLLTKNGKSWTTQSINGSPTDLNEIRAIDARTVYACGKGGMLLKTMDGGETWNLCKKVASEDFTSMTVKPDGTISLNAGLKQVSVNDQEGKYSVKTYYDQHGRVVASQNSKQRAMSPQRFSYMVYDALDRVVETGEMESNKEPTSLLIKGSIFSRFPNNMSGRRFQVVRTIYDKPIYNSPVNKIRKAFGGDQKHLRNRIATILYQKEYNSDPTQYDYATHYSYDIHGNVAVLVQDMPELESIGQRFKRINYEYGIVSGKVISMNYQLGQPDGYSLRYEYDDENRLTRVLASYHGNNTEHEIARYEYYRHGPLARMVLGDTLQGVDYAYTLQGWTKGVNADAAGHDMGGDGKNNVKRDVYGYTLQYNENDYNPIGRDSSFYQSVSSGGLAGRDLYNGNIAKMSTYLTNLSSQTFGTQTRSFVYDELNRLKRSQVVGSDAYKTSYDYDANGNITGLTRYGMNGQAIDNLTYHYALDKKGNILNNRLLHVNDAVRPVGNSSTSSDIKNQGDSYAQYDPTSHNYVYDKMGNLIKDKSEEIAEITWTATGKVSDVIRTNGSSKPDLHFDYDAMGQRIAKTVTNKNVTTGDLKVTTYYVRDPRGNVLAVYEKKEDAVGDGQFQLKERHLYGASRLGMVSQNVILTQFDKLTSNQTQNSTTPQLGNTHYELTNHLGNVMAVITDEVSADSTPSIASLSDYYPFGMTEPGRNWSADAEGYRYGFQGQDRERELWGGEASFFTYRISDNRLGRFFSVDPLSSKYPWNSSYAFSENRLIDGVELEGLEYLDVNNKNIGKGAVENVNGRTNLTLGSTTFEGVQIENIGGTNYYNLGKHMYFSDNGWSETGSRQEQQTDETKVGLQLVNGLLSLSWTADPRPWNEATVQQTIDEAHNYINPGGLCYVNTMARVNKAYKDAHGIEQVLDYEGEDYDLSAVKTKDPYGAARALEKKGYARLVTPAGIWEGKLQKGAVIQKHHFVKGNNMYDTKKGYWGHSYIFIDYVYDKFGNIVGYDYIDAEGINNGSEDDDGYYVPSKGHYDPRSSETEKYGGNLIDK